LKVSTMTPLWTREVRVQLSSNAGKTRAIPSMIAP
jgi:hypothetical protein